jgi:hypothetical protein
MTAPPSAILASERELPLRLYEGRAVIIPHPIAVDMEHPYRDSKRQRGMAARPSSIFARRVSFALISSAASTWCDTSGSARVVTSRSRVNSMGNG